LWRIAKDASDSVGLSSVQIEEVNGNREFIASQIKLVEDE